MVLPCEREQFQFVPNKVTGLGVETDGRLVKNKQFRLVDEGPGEQQPTLHTPGKFLYVDIFFFGELDKIKEIELPLVLQLPAEYRNNGNIRGGYHRW